MECKVTQIAELWKQMQKKAPLIHCITNAVTVNDCANVLLAAGARPTMAHHPAEVEEVTGGCDALVCNFGATDDYEAMFLAAERASQLGHPVILDPVGAGGSSFRREKIKELCSRAQIAVIRGNASEMRAVFEDTFTVTGVDAGKTDESETEKLIFLAKEFAEKHACICVISGSEDIITDGRRVIKVRNGHEDMTRITGSGCMSTVLLGALFAALSEDQKKQGMGIFAAAAAVMAMGICGELAAKCCKKDHRGTMSFKMYLIDTMSLMQQEMLELFADISLNKIIL